mgnify:FL=1|jgi:hypothetical protein
MSRDRTKWQEEQLESHGIFLNLDQIGYTEIHKCNEMATHYYEFIFCRTGNTNDNKMITACQSHSLEIENYIWRVSAIGLNMLQYIDEQLSTEELKWADSAYERGFISSFLKISPIVEDSFRDGLRKRFGLRSNEIEKSMYDRYLDSDGNLHCRNVYMRRSISNQFNLLFQPLFKRNLDKLLKKPKDTAPDGYVLDIIKGSIPETTELFRSHLPMK